MVFSLRCFPPYQINHCNNIHVSVPFFLYIVWSALRVLYQIWSKQQTLPIFILMVELHAFAYMRIEKSRVVELWGAQREKKKLCHFKRQLLELGSHDNRFSVYMKSVLASKKHVSDCAIFRLLFKYFVCLLRCERVFGCGNCNSQKIYDFKCKSERKIIRLVPGCVLTTHANAFFVSSRYSDIR